MKDDLGIKDSEELVPSRSQLNNASLPRFFIIHKYVLTNRLSIGSS